MVSGFQALAPAFSILLPFHFANQNTLVGPINSGGIFEFAGGLVNGSYLRSEEGYGSQAVNAEFIFGASTVRLDTDKQHARISYDGIAQTDDGVNIYVDMSGTVANGPGTDKLFGQDSSFNGSDFGLGFFQARMSTGANQYKFVEDVQYVAAQRYVILPGPLLGLEFKLSQVVQPTSDSPAACPNNSTARRWIA